VPVAVGVAKTGRPASPQHAPPMRQDNFNCLNRQFPST
jgi:hypothetical protein